MIAATFNGVDFDLTVAATDRSRSNGVGLALVGGQPAIAYTGNQLGYTTFDGTSWSDRTVVGPFNLRGISLGASLTLQQLANGQPAVVGDDPKAGQILFMTPDVVPPTVAPDNIPNVTESGGTSYTFTLQYTDDVFIDTATIDALDVTVLAPDGSPITADGGTVLAAAQTNDPATVAARVQPDVVPAAYNIVPPGGDWDRADNGIYTVAVNVTQVADVNANFVAANPALATFIVNIIPSEDDDDDGEQEVIMDAGLPSDDAAITAPPGVLAPVEVLPATGEAPFWRQYALAAAVLVFVLGLATKMGWR